MNLIDIARQFTVFILTLALSACVSTTATTRTPAGASSKQSQRDVAIPDPQGFLGWKEIAGYRTSDKDVDKLQAVELKCDKTELFPTHPSQATKLYHAAQIGLYQQTKIPGTSEACKISGKFKTTRGTLPCLMADSLKYFAISDTYQDRCGNFYRGLVEVRFWSRDESMGTLFSRGRTVYPKPHSDFEGEMEEGGTYAVDYNDMLLVTELFPGDQEAIAKYKGDALANGFRFNSTTLLFERKN